VTRRRLRRLRIALALTLLVWVGWRAYRAHVGSPADRLHDASWTEATRVLARDGRILGELPSTEGLRGRETSLDEMGERIVLATIASEDKGYWAHDGVDRAAILRALFTNVSRGRIVSGGSTITQQLVKRLDHHGHARPKSFVAKLRETARAMNLESKEDKRAILEAYMNRLDYGRGFAGPEAAALGYFGVHAKDLSLAQATVLAVLPRAPTALDPYRHRERALLRQRALLRSLHALGRISTEDRDRALAEPLVWRDANAPRPFVAPHVVAGAARKKVQLSTTLDFDLQRDVEALVRSHTPRLEEKGATTSAVVVVDVATGEVLAEVSGPDWFDASRAGKVDLVRSRRQAGSTLKPLVYARAFEKGVSPMDPLPDVPTDFGQGGGPSSAKYAPDNFDGTFLGPIAAREALAGSLNVPAVKLARDLGAADVVTTMRAAGLLLDGGAQRYGLSIALGSAEISPLELAEAYATLARGGEHLALRDRGTARRATTRVLDAASVAAVSDALSDPFARVRGLRTRGPFELPFPTAVKTGTSTAYRDAWTAGYTRERVVVVWAGNASGAATRGLTGAVGAGPLFFDVMKRTMRDVPARAALYDASLLEQVEVCPLSGRRAGPACSTHVSRRVPKGHAHEGTCGLHRFATGSRCDAHGKDPVVVLPEVYGRFLDMHPPGAPGMDPFGVPWHLASRMEDCDGTPDDPRIVVLAPRDGTVVPFDPNARDVVDLDVETHGLPPREPLEVVVDGRVALRLEAPYRARVPVSRGDHAFEVRPADGRRPAMLGRVSVSVR
jgi:penicillin-binding protein 1C